MGETLFNQHILKGGDVWYAESLDGTAWEGDSTVITNDVRTLFSGAVALIPTVHHPHVQHDPILLFRIYLRLFVR
ncbi:unnamed protein product [Cylicocyclus nassatus]|uniref:Uncharacterized protein n=1 Tax=Cylicocyclus nassatus TaxID=53992 RepID=A0AA36MGK9_CYLNA|nr:unnamed protein product [Cylicocyclus nassatus]